MKKISFPKLAATALLVAVGAVSSVGMAVAAPAPQNPGTQVYTAPAPSPDDPVLQLARMSAHNAINDLRNLRPEDRNYFNAQVDTAPNTVVIDNIVGQARYVDAGGHR